LHAHVPVLLTRIIIGPRAVSDEAHDTARTSPDSYRGNNRRNSTPPPPSPPLGSSSLMLSRFLVSSVPANVRERRHTVSEADSPNMFYAARLFSAPLPLAPTKRRGEERSGEERTARATSRCADAITSRRSEYEIRWRRSRFRDVRH